MPCKICHDPRRGDVDAAVVGGESVNKIAERFGLSRDSLKRHTRAHIAQAIARAREHAAAEIVTGSNLSRRIADLAADAQRIKAKAEETGELDTALRAIGQLVRMVELLAKAEGEIGEGGTTVNVAVVQSGEWVALRDRIVAALSPFPEAKQAVLAAIRAEAS